MKKNILLPLLELLKKHRQLFNLIFILTDFSLLIVLGFFIWNNGQSKKQESQQTASSAISKSQKETKQSSSDSQETVDTSLLQSGSNHNIAADAYAHNAAEIRSYIDGSTPTNQKLVFLTFDDGIDSNVTPTILDTLKNYGVPATFFEVGYTLTSSHQELIQRQIAEGHAIAIHSMTHNFSLLYPGRVPNTATIISEINQTQAALQNLLGSDFHTNVVRYPGGHMSWSGLEEADAQLAAQGMQWIDWNMLVGDAEPAAVRPTNSETMMTYLQNSMRKFPDSPVKVVLMHDITGKELTAQTLPQIIEYFQNQGYSFGVLE
ncbi:polysaccharide deacetylase family protein [Streptococcus dentiloxodontae]